MIDIDKKIRDFRQRVISIQRDLANGVIQEGSVLSLHLSYQKDLKDAIDQYAKEYKIEEPSDG